MNVNHINKTKSSMGEKKNERAVKYICSDED